MRVQSERAALRGTFLRFLVLASVCHDIFLSTPFSQIERKKIQHNGNVVLENISAPAHLYSYSPTTNNI
jgi:hypothetical protein